MQRDNSYLKGNKFAVGAKPNKTAFKKGSIAWNKGKKGTHFSKATEFKKGQKGINWVEVGTIKNRVSKKGGSRNFIKIAEPNKWVELAKHLWLSEYGKIIVGDIIHHLDGVSDHDTIENLIALPRTDHPIFHSKWGIKQLTPKQKEFYIGRYK